MTTPLIRNSINRSLLRCGFLLITLTLGCFALSSAPKAFGVSPAPDGGYPAGNTAEGTNALNSLTTGIDNTATGSDALFSITAGNDNTATGFDALASNTGDENTATGSLALLNNTIGSDNTATGWSALSKNSKGEANTATGEQALNGNTSGNFNTATGLEALFNNDGNNNTATGEGALFNNTTSGNNTADGFQALVKNTTGSNNTALGYLAGENLTTGSNNIDIGANVLGIAREANTIRIGKQGTQKATFVAGISGVAVSGSTVVVNSSGKLGVAGSSARFKEQIKPMDRASEAILALTPVTFRYKEEIDPEKIPQFGLVAEEVEKVDPDLVTRNDKGEAETVRYDAVNAMLLNEFLKEHRQVQELKSIAAKQEATIAKQQQQIEALTAGLQRVSAQVEMSKPAPQMLVKNQ